MNIKHVTNVKPENHFEIHICTVPCNTIWRQHWMNKWSFSFQPLFWLVPIYFNRWCPLIIAFRFGCKSCCFGHSNIRSLSKKREKKTNPRTFFGQTVWFRFKLIMVVFQVCRHRIKVLLLINSFVQFQRIEWRTNGNRNIKNRKNCWLSK